MRVLVIGAGGFVGRAVVQAIRQAWPASLPLFVRISATDWADGGWTAEDSVGLAKRRAVSRGLFGLIGSEDRGLMVSVLS